MKKLHIQTLMVAIICLMLTSCYKKFDPKSYAPLFTINGFSTVKEIQPSALVAYWAFDGGLADSVSSTAGTNKGTTFSNGFMGQALTMNAANKAHMLFDPGAAITGLKSFTISFWVNPVFVDVNNDNGIDGVLGLVNLSNTTGFWGNIDWFVENGSNNSAAIIKAHITSGTKETWVEVKNYPGFFGVWSNHTLTYDAGASTFRYYINGSVVATTTAAWTGDIIFTNSGPMVFGCVQFQANPSLGTAGGPQDWASYLTGSLDEVRIYNTALPASEINALVVLQGKGK
ncbi:LamG domain-containing protein [Agriterribacter sp.]|uniref:LamG domain-containing protein n=1 Tax=Agriterribacter sp. TaxID=2821509 RepID=UPI002BD4A94D|nr:LamG domain-containing protein [Agriterribacter sp.]HTN08565.1 LamG domain-containing protein [Agriterribacter sp.]